jgi:hypothetical protein
MVSIRLYLGGRWAVRSVGVKTSGPICGGTLRGRPGLDPPLIPSSVVPELAGSLGRIDAGILPPGGFIAYAVHQSMMDAAERDRELVARLAAQGLRLQVA